MAQNSQPGKKKPATRRKKATTASTTTAAKRKTGTRTTKMNDRSATVKSFGGDVAFHDIQFEVGPANGKAGRLVIASFGDVAYRDTIDVNNATARRRYIAALAEKVGVPVEDLPDLDHAICDEADKADAVVGNIVKHIEHDGAGGGKQSQSTLIVELATDAELFHTPDGEAFATVQVGEHHENWLLKTKGFRRWMARRFFQKYKKAPGAQAFQDALAVLEGQALNDGEEHDVYIRLAEHENKIYLDLCNSMWECVEVSENGWRVTSDPPVKFRRTRGMLPLPHPVAGGDITELRRFVNTECEDDWILFLGALLGAMQPKGPFAILVLHGEQGSAKSTLARVMRSIIDPNKAGLRSQPRDERDLVIAASNSWYLVLDNLSWLPPWLSDSLCRLATGGGFATRELYTDTDEALFDSKRPIVLNGIEELASRGDLLDRGIILYLSEILPENRRSERDLWADFESARPGILGALLDAVAASLRNLPTTHLPGLPRMADFAQWVVAGERALGLSDGSFMRVKWPWLSRPVNAIS
jgi:hypothetical protein